MTPPNTDHLAGAWSAGLRCHWRHLEALSDTHLRVYLPPHGCTDMGGVIRLARAIMPKVQRIETYGGETLDTVYIRQARGQWVADLRREGCSPMPRPAGG